MSAGGYTKEKYPRSLIPIRLYRLLASVIGRIGSESLDWVTIVKAKKTMTVAMATASMCAASLVPAQQAQADAANDICAFIGVGTGAAGLSKAKAAGKAASWIGIVSAVGCWSWAEASAATPAETHAAMKKSYDDFKKKDALGQLSDLGYSCKIKPDTGPGTDLLPQSEPLEVSYRGDTYTCSTIRD